MNAKTEALKMIREAGNNLDPTAQWMQKWAAHGMEPDKFPMPCIEPPDDEGGVLNPGDIQNLTNTILNTVGENPISVDEIIECIPALGFIKGHGRDPMCVLLKEMDAIAERSVEELLSPQPRRFKRWGGVNY